MRRLIAQSSSSANLVGLPIKPKPLGGQIARLAKEKVVFTSNAFTFSDCKRNAIFQNERALESK
jgi:hypothetical protein